MTTLYLGGRIFTAVPEAPFADALVIEGSRIAFVGDEAGARAAAGAGAEVVDLRGRMIMPGIHDAHIHLLLAAIKVRPRNDIRLPVAASTDEILVALEAARDAGVTADDGWLIGGDVFPTPPGEERLSRERLDASFPDTPVYVRDYAQHHGFANSAALRLAGIDESTPDPEGGIIVRRADGSLTGELVERAVWPLYRVMPKHDQAYVEDTVEWALGECVKYGITSIQDASAGPRELIAFRALENAGRLKVHIAAHLVYNNEVLSELPFAEEKRLLDEAGEWASEHVDTAYVKMFVDGAPLPPNTTHSVLHPDGSIDETWLLLREPELTEAIDRYDADGRLVKLHCSGEGAARAAVDAIERVRARRDSGLPHEIAHAGFVHPDDLARMARLGITAEMSPAIWHEPEYGLGEGFRFAEVLAAGVRMTIGSDWVLPPTPNLFPGIQGTLQHRYAPIDLLTALGIVTRVGAEQVRALDTRGTLEPGKDADYLVLDRDLFAVPVDAIAGTVVESTFIAGEQVHPAPRP